MKRISIVFAITELPIGGTEHQLLELVKGLDKTKFRPIVLVLQRGGQLEQDFRRVPGVRVISLTRRGMDRFLTLLVICVILRRIKADIVQAFMTPAIFYSLVAALICRTPAKIITERSGPGRKKGTPLRYRIYLTMEDLLSKFTDAVVTNSAAGKCYLAERGIDPSLVRVIYNGINLSRLYSDEEDIALVRKSLGVPPGSWVVGIVASLIPVKNHETFIMAAATISAIRPDVRFAVIGEGPLRSQIETLCRELGISSRVCFLGNQHNIGTYISALDIAVLTSDTEGCSNFILEAMALGKPVIATAVGGNRELVLHGETGVLVPPRDSKALAEAIIDLIQHPEKVANMGQKTRERVMNQFSLDNMVRQYESLYENIIKYKVNHGGSSSTDYGQRIEV